MGKYRRVWVVYRKELTDTLRDRRTLIAMVVAPVLLYPILMVVISEALQAEKERREREVYKVCVPDEVHRSWMEAVLRREDADRAAVGAADREAGRSAGEDAPDDDAGLRADLSADQVEISVVGPSNSMWDLVADKKYHLGVLVDPPPSPTDQGDRRNRIVQFIYCDTVPLSEFAYYKLNEAIANEADRLVQSRLAAVPGGAGLLDPYVQNSLSTAGPDMQFAKILAAIVPFLLVVMTVTGAMYPAIDLTAGERERGTLETLAVSPAPVGQIVAGKFGVVITIAMFTTVLNLASMTAMIHLTQLDQIAAQRDAPGEAAKVAVELEIESAGKTADTSGPTQFDYLERRRQLQDATRQSVGSLTKAAPLVLATMIPFAILFSAVMLAACSFARTFKEAQNYMMPVMMCAMIPAMVVSYMPSIRLEGALLVVPVANIVVLIRELLLGNSDVAATAVALLSTCLYAGVAVSVAARLYGNEAVLFSDVGSYKTLLLRRFFRPRVRPTAEEAALLLAVVFPINFYWQSWMIDLDSSGTRLKWVLAVAQVIILAGPAVLLAWYRKLDLRETFSLRVPGAVQLLGAVLVAVAAAPMSLLIYRIQVSVFGAPGSLEVFEQMDARIAAGSALAAFFFFALLPGVCEEILFRGLLQSGVRDKLGVFGTVVLVGVLFGLFHMALARLPVTTAMGILLTLVCLRSGSIFPAMLIHVAHNAVPILAQRVELVRRIYGSTLVDDATPAATLDGHTIAFIAMFVVGLALIVRGRTARRRDS